MTAIIHAQAPQLLNYQAVVRDASGQPLSGGLNVAVRFQIHDLSGSGTVIYQETTSALTNQLGYINLAIGASGNLSTVDWGSGPKYLEVDIDPTGGSNFAPMGTAQLVSVPYALFAANSQAGPQGPTGPDGSAGNTGPQGAAGVDGAYRGNRRWRC